jgi:hypothetical protein
MRMKTKLTTEEREQFFGLYWGQKVGIYGDSDEPNHLSLKSLSSLSDEDKKWILVNGGLEPEDLEFLERNSTVHLVTAQDMVTIVDYLRRKGYLLGATLMNKEGVCTHYTAEELIEDGVAKIGGIN